MLFNKTKLKNGLAVVTEEHSQSRGAAFGLWVETGSRDEARDKTGISHFVEHLVFKGTKSRTAIQIARSLEELGGDLNAYTTKEYTCFHGLTLREHWKQNLDVILDLAFHAQFAKTDFELERKVILQEIAMSAESLEDFVYDIFYEQAFCDSKMAHSILGTQDSIENMTRKDVDEYYDKRYSPKQVIISGAGGIEHARVVEYVQKYLAKKITGTASTKRSIPKFHGVRSHVEHESEQVHLLVGFSAPSFHDKFRFENFILNSLLGGGMTSLLFQNIREKRGLAYSVYSMIHSFTDFGFNTIYAGCAPDKVKTVLGIILKETERIVKKGLSQRQIDFYKRQVKGNLLLAADDVENRMTSLGVNEMVFREHRSVESVVAEMEAVNVDSMREFLRTVDLDKLAIVTLGSGLKSGVTEWIKKQ